MSVVARLYAYTGDYQICAISSSATSDRLHLVMRRVAVFAVCVMFLTVVVQIIARYVFSSPPVWTEDVARYAMVWTGLLGATLSFKTQSDAVSDGQRFP